MRDLWRYFGLNALVIILLFAPSSRADAPAKQGLLGSPFTITVTDQYDKATPNATVAIRRRDDYAVVGVQTTNRWGCTTFSLDPAMRYIVWAYYNDNGSNELWYYGYIEPADWSPTPARTLPRVSPWLNVVIAPADATVGESWDVVATIAHGYPVTNFDLRLRLRMWVDDDGQAPYLYETTSPTQIFSEGIEPFNLSYTPEVAGHYMMRLLLERNWEGQGWEPTDEGGWQWSFDVVAPATTPTATPTLTSAPTPTSTPVLCTISGIVFRDSNHDGLYEATDPPVSGVEVVLRDGGGATLGRRLTGIDGAYRFEQVTTGHYQVALDAVPAGYDYTRKVQELDCLGGQIVYTADFPLNTLALIYLPALTKRGW